MAANVQSMCQYWKTFDLQELQKELDTTATELASRQDDSDISRKRLVEQSREFKKNTPEDIRKVVAPLLKSFQGEIDALSKRSKAAEASFLTIYKRLIDLPDPVPVLEHALQLQKRAHKSQDLEIENKQLRETLDDYNNEFAEVKNQEVTIKLLKEKLKEYEDKMEVASQAKAKEKERELQRLFAEKEQQRQESQLSVAKKLGEAEHKVATLQSALDTTQSELFDLKSKYDEATSAKSDEMEMVMGDLERANERAAAAEREVEQLKHQLVSATQNLHQAEQMQQAPDMEQAIDILKRSSLEVELAAKEKEIAQLVEDVQRLQASVNKLRDVSSSQINKLEEELAAKNQAFKLLEEKLETQEDYEEMRRELEILKSIEFSNSSDESIESTKGKSLEMLLMEKNRALQSENTQVKVANNEISGTSGNDVNGTEVKSESPTDLSNTDKFASFLGEEIAATYQESSSSPQPESNSSTAGENTVIKDEMKVDEPALDSVDSVEMNGDVDSASDNGADMTEIHREVDKDVDTVPEEVEVDNEPEKNVLDDSPSFEINTAEVSQQIREVMSAHNIGQKHFANHVLGLSQGTLSDLLSKPKSWDQLSEKGRDWYRKMYLWCLDERNVLALKAMASRKASREYPPPEDLEAFANMYQGQNLAAYQMSNSGSEPSTPPVLPRGVKLEKSMDSSMDSSSLNGENSVLSEQIDGVALQKLQTIAQKESNNSPALNTADVSQKIREILSTHNIGQRLFAKHVLSLSQGTVSELLSKPKHWDKLTEKGRESYRKMFAWSLDGRNVMALKAISPRKGSTPITSPYKHEDSQTEERIAQILSDAQTAMQAKQAQEKVYMHDVHMATHMVNSIYQQELAKMAHNSSFNGASPYHMVADMPQERQKERPREKDKENRGHKKERRERSRTSEEQRHQDDAGMSEEIVRRIYQKELEKLAQAAQSMGNMAECRMYQQELARLAQNAQHEEQVQAHHEREREKQNHHMAQHHHPHHPMHQDIKPHLNNNHYDFHIKNEPLDLSDHSSHLKSPQNQSDTQSNCSDSTQDAARHAGSAFCLVRPKSEGMPLDASYPSNSMSPLQHMQTIANSLVSKSQMPFPPQKPLKAVLPPITQEQFDCYSTINTDDLVKRVKETLSQYSISQRLFGEHVLGLSQGSVSDLLARPKPWHMLTQKGREPFIRMQIFLEDAEAIPKLVASQYRIAPDKLMRSNAMYLANHVAAHRKRKNHHISQAEDQSLENTNSSGGVPMKKARVFFSEEQKETLRQTYLQDPYPNQSTIEALAMQLGVAPKTVINWFHNHRMRTKQQAHPGTPTNDNGSDAENSQAKNEDGENMSDNSELSNDYNQYMHSQSREMTQWMFPSFEPVNLSRASSANSFESNHLMDNGSNAKDSDSESLCNGADGQRRLSLSASNRRKSAKPQWVYQGIQLDKSQRQDGMDLPVMSEGSDVLTTQGDHSERSTPATATSVHSHDSRLEVDDLSKDGSPRDTKIKKLQKAIERSELEWEEVDRSEKISRLEKNLHEENGRNEGWEF
ncbi:homeobox protein cut-like 1 isoform X3 [Lineus longissimus]|uniref:homeobox protein cut-like 1 isoform X3 n=1 Tax=Lineus longissimus TaxID=88925 RepID=UPI00315D875A